MGEDDFEQKILAMEDKWEWDCIEAVVDSGSVDTVINPKRLPGHKVVETDDSRNGAHWTCAGSTKIAKIGMIRLPWVTNDNERMRTEVMVGAVGKTLVSTHRLDETGYDTMLTKVNPRIVHRESGETIKLEKRGKMHILKMWVRINKGTEVVQNKTVQKEEVNTVTNDDKVRVFRRPVAAKANP